MTGYRLCEKFWEAIEHYGTNCWSVEILWDGLTLDEANIYEQIEIRDNETLYPHGYNLKEGGDNATQVPESRAKMKSENKLPLIHGAAALFAFITRDATELASYFNVKEPTVKRWAKTHDWEQTLDVLGYTGDRTFQRQPHQVRDDSKTFQLAKAAYMKAVFDGIPPHQRASRVAKAAGITPRRVRNWVKRFEWESESGDWASETET